MAVIVALTLTTFLRNGIWRNTIYLWDDVVTKSPGEGRGLVNLGGAWLDAGHNEIAVHFLEKSKGIKPTWNVAFLYLGDIHFNNGEYEAAEKEFLDALKQNKNDTGALLRMAMLDAAKGRFQSALDTVDKTIELDVFFPDAYMMRGIILSKMKRPEEALSSLEKAYLLSPDHPRILLNLGIVLFEAGRYCEAERYLKEGTVDARLWLGRTYLKIGRYDESIRAYEEYITSKQDDNSARFELAVAYEKAGSYDKAVKEHQRILAVSNKDRNSIEALKRLKAYNRK